MSSPYDALLDPPAQASPYDALLDSAPPQASPYDALLTDAPPNNEFADFPKPSASMPETGNGREKPLELLTRPEGSGATEADYPLDSLGPLTRPKVEAARKSDYRMPSFAEAAMTPAATIIPKLDPEQAGKLARATDVTGISNLLPKAASDRVAGIAENVIADTANFFTSPTGILTMGLGGAPKVVQSLVAGIFAAHAAKDAPETIQAIADAKTPQERDAAIVAAIENAGVLAGGAAHTFGRAPITATERAASVDEARAKISPVPPEQEAIAPLTAAAVSETATPPAEPPPIPDQTAPAETPPSGVEPVDAALPEDTRPVADESTKRAEPTPEQVVREHITKSIKPDPEGEVVINGEHYDALDVKVAKEDLLADVEHDLTKSEDMHDKVRDEITDFQDELAGAENELKYSKGESDAALKRLAMEKDTLSEADVETLRETISNNADITKEYTKEANKLRAKIALREKKAAVFKEEMGRHGRTYDELKAAKVGDEAGTPVSTVGRVLDELGVGKQALAENAVKAPAPIQTAIDGWKGNLKSLFNVVDSANRFIESGPQRDIVAAKFDAATNQAGYVARQARRHVELASGEKRLSSSEEALRQKAATFVRQANGDKEGMLAKLQGIKGKGYDAIILYAEKHWDALEAIANAAKEGTDAAHAQATESGAALDYRDNYVKGSYEDIPNRKVIFDETGGGGTGGSFKKAKVFNDYAEAIAAGYKPKELRLDLLTESAVNGMLKAVNRQKWAQSLGEVSMPDGRPLVTEAKENGSAPDGYRMVQVTPGRLVPVVEDLAPTIEALTRDSLIPKIIAGAAGTVKHNILVFDVFHASRFAQMQAAFEGRLPSYHKGLTLLEFADADLARAQQRGLITADEALWAKTNRPKLEALVGHGLNAGRISDALFKDVAAIMPGTKQVNSFIFDKLSRGIITQTGIYALERNAKLYPKMSEPELLRYTAKEVNTYYRNLGSQGIFKSRTFQDLARSLLLAPQWAEGLLRSEARGYGQLAKAPVTGKVGNVGKAMATGLVAYFAAGQVVNMLTRGKPTWENDEPGHKLDAWVPDVMQGSNGYFVSPMSVFAETTHDAAKYIERGKSPADVPAQILDNKFHPMVRAFRDLFYGKDFYGRPLQGFDRVTQAASEIAPIPLFARTSGYKGAAERQILSTAGIKATTAPSSTADVYQLAHDFKEKSGIKTLDAFPESDYAKLRRAIQNQDAKVAKEEFETLKKEKGLAKVDAYFSQMTRRSFTGSAALEEKFRKSLDRGQLDIYNAALLEREAIAKFYRSSVRR